MGNLVSVIINCYNGERYLSEAIESVLNQTHANWELIFWDNQSTDRSACIANSYQDARVKYFRAKKHTPLYEARNLALTKSKGDFIAFLDADDVWFRTKLERQLRCFENPDVGISCTNYFLEVHGKNRSIGHKKRKSEGFVLERLLKDYFVLMSSLMIRRSVLVASKSTFNKSYQIIGDFDLVIRLAGKNQLSYLESPEVLYRIHNDNLSIKSEELYLEELNSMRYEIRANKSFAPRSISLLNNYIGYISGIQSLSNKDRKTAIKHLTDMSLSLLQLRLLFAIGLPFFVFNFLRPS